jgi:hypothetical protein
MPSTYTLNNGIELIATGEQSGTWGDTTNVNLGLIDTALDGQVTVTLPAAGSSGSPNALAISDGSASDGRNRLIIFDDGGDLGATAFVQLTPNDAEKIVYIRNNLTGGRAITLFQGTYNASNDYEVPAGTTAVVFFNGGGAGAVAANVFNNAFFDSLRLGAVSVTAILDEDNMASDSATALATQQSIKAYVDAQVGANNELSEVLANGNTSGGNNIQMTTTDEVQFRDTALTISSSVDGQLDIAADVELEIVAPTLDINASTAVTIDTTTMTMTGSVNVVGDLDVDNLNINGNSIISTNTDGNIALTPNGTGEVDISKVDIDGGTIDGTVIGGASAAAISGTTGSFSGNLTVDTNTLFVDAANNRVGMGTSSPARQVTINSSFPILQFTNPTTGTTSNDGLLIFQSGLDAYFSNQEAGPTIFETNNAERMRIDASGNVGIGTSLPGNPLTLVYGGGAVGAQIIGNASYAQMQVTAAGANTNSYFTFGANGTGKGIIQRNSTDVITIDASNNVGIGTSSPSTYGKVVSSGGTFALVTDTPAERRLSFWSTANGNSENGYIQVQNDGLTTNTGEMLFATKNTAGTLAERMRITSTGLVGIGTSSPAVKLTSQLASSGISGIASTAAALFENSGNSDVVIAAGTSSKSRIAFGDSGDWIAGRIDYDHSDNSMRFGTAGSGERLRIDASGNVGIGTSSPGAKLDVSGSFRTSDTTSLYGAASVRGINFGSAEVAWAQATTGCYLNFSDASGNNGGNYGLTIRGLASAGAAQAAMAFFTVDSVSSGFTGSLSKGSGSFKIDHPLKPDTHHLVHSFVESPQADNIYRGKIALVGGSAVVNIDTVAGMTEGTFAALNREIQCFTSNETGWCNVRGSVMGNTLTIEAQDNTCTDTISWLVIGERQDQHMYDTDWTDENGKVIVEPLKEQPQL